LLGGRGGFEGRIFFAEVTHPFQVIAEADGFLGDHGGFGAVYGEMKGGRGWEGGKRRQDIVIKRRRRRGLKVVVKPKGGGGQRKKRK